MQTDKVANGRGGTGVWIFRVLLVAAAAFMVYSWFAPWWSATVAALPGKDHLVMRPWGVEVVAQVKASGDASLYSMPWFFTPFMWTYLTVCMLALAASLFVTRSLSIGPIKLPVAVILIGLVGLSYMFALGVAYGVGELKAGWAGAKFIGTSSVKNAMSGAKVKMVSDLQLGYWLALGAGGVIFVLALIRGLFVGKSR
jgi:hypothetical protein